MSGNAGEYDEATERKKHSSADSSSRQESRAFYDEDLRPVVKVSLRWLKPIGFAAALRNQEYPRQTIALLEYFRQHKSGDIRQILNQSLLCEHALAEALGLIVRLAIRGYIKLDLTANSFGYRTPWTLSEGD